MPAQVRVTIRYFVRGNSQPASVDVAPEDYFEPVREGESFEDMGIPRLDHAREYLDQRDLAWTEVTVEGATGSSTIREEFSATGLTTMWQRTDSDGYREIGLVSQQKPNVVEIVRLVRSGESFAVGSWRRISSAEDGTEADEDLWQAPVPAPGSGRPHS